MFLYLLKDFLAHKSFFNNSFVGILLFNRSFHVLVLYRLTNFLAKLKFFKIFIPPIRYFSNILTNCDISPYAKIGFGFILQHPFSVIISGDSVIGNNVILFHNVTIGKKARGRHVNLAPRIGDNVTIYCNSSLFGNISIGANTIIGAHSLVLDSFSGDSVIFGSPAKLFRK